jgi:hypothetical protein
MINYLDQFKHPGPDEEKDDIDKTKDSNESDFL